MFLGRTGSSSDAVTAGASAKHQHHVSWFRGFAAHLVSLHGTYHGTYFQTFSRISFIIYFPYMGSCKTDLVSVAGISMSSLLRNHALRQLALKRLGHRLVDIARAGHAHCLINVGTA